MNSLPTPGFNLPPGVSLRDIDPPGALADMTADAIARQMRDDQYEYLIDSFVRDNTWGIGELIDGLIRTFDDARPYLEENLGAAARRWLKAQWAVYRDEHINEMVKAGTVKLKEED